ncbi:MAG TPA: beta-ketoacyl-[acyl-carrier-protein] synthase family protein [Anaerohalosphaeraceae bacterium]|nr:beta-ketoacyl-[acyl-carrier-protein] synthase family protein [Anaerohalosphaeraceae bacterium]HQG05505.1 beta-ketoacyl-[acyl-carrier-protein] synthase family protein [Anaerohalosphaeraceae bacterium]HQI06878.1 beta-ketoacyl-[acyl-carrier-protein] synthase family protein [Anaerohalosphaeraceae bacterium]HQJ68536.1 beta-ketoacyl-[acyl-carrier-protein] synthase family protein [Anaerohalosphaeraceae bacterium]
MADRRTVITAVGAVSPLGLSSRQMWEGLLQGRCGIARIRAFDPVKMPCQIAGEVPDYNIRDYVPKAYRKAAKLMCRDIELSVIAADEAMRNSGLRSKAIDPDHPTLPSQRTGIEFGAGIISCDLLEIAPSVAVSAENGRFDMKKWGREGIPTVTPLWLLKYLPNMLACHIGIIHDIQGPSNTITSGEVSSHIAVTEAAEMIQREHADVVLAGGGEAKVNPLLMVRQCLLKRSTFSGNDNPSAACRPFDAGAGGSVFGEGAAALMLEELNFAKQRNAPILAEFAGGFSSVSDTDDYIHLKNSRGLEIAIEEALAQAQIRPDQLDLIIPHGTGIPHDDRIEAAALQKILGKAAPAVPVWPLKGQLSHTGSAAGALDMAAAVMAIQNQMLGAAYNLQTPAEGCALSFPKQPMKHPIRTVLCCGYSFGGHTAAVVLKRYEETE